LQKKYIEVATEEGGVAAAGAHGRKLLKSLEVCEKEGIHFVPLAWESTGGATETVHETVRKWTELEGARGGYPAYLIRRNLYAQISCCLQRHLAQAVIDRRLEASCDRVLLGVVAWCGVCVLFAVCLFVWLFCFVVFMSLCLFLFDCVLCMFYVFFF
jgi:hypothetical protein